MSKEIMLSSDESKRLSACESAIKKCADTWQDAGNALLEIREHKLYRAEYGTFELYCKTKWGYVRRYANYLIAGARVMKVLGTSGSQTLPPRIVRPLISLPDESIKKTFKAATETAKEQGREVTGKDVAEAVRKTMPPPPRKKIVDCIGREIPKNLIDLWMRREAPLEVCKHLSAAKVLIEKAEHDHDLAFVRIHLQTELANITGLYSRIKESAFAYVCGLCQGVGCKACKVGLMSKQQWIQLVPKETKEMIERGIKK